MTTLLRVRFRHFDLGPYQGWEDEDDYPAAIALSAALNHAHSTDLKFPLPYEDCLRAGARHDLDVVQRGQAWADARLNGTRDDSPAQLHMWRCAFATRDQLDWWFDASWRAKLDAAGFVIAEVTLREGEPVAHGSRQSVYRKESVEKARRIAW